ncbi:fibronectin type III domain-containing protein [Chitinophaga dinghuensis]|nr:fibronectin type III domain-containing protein [Chitinophaga dinghuensis]
MKLLHKHLLTALLTLMLSAIWAGSEAQNFPVTAQVQVLPPVSAQITSLYQGTRPKMIVTLINTDMRKPVLKVRLRFTIKGTLATLRNKDYAYYPPIELEAGVPLQLTLDDLAPYFKTDNLDISGIPSWQFAQTSKLPDGYYTYCVEVIETISGQQVSSPQLGCSPTVWITTSEPPLLNLPKKGETVAMRDPMNLIFNWTPRHMNSPNAAFQTQYEFTIAELWDTITPPEAAFSNTPPLYQEIVNTTTFLYGPVNPPLLPYKRYAWRVRAIAKQGLDEYDIFRNNGYSEIFYFSLQEDCQPPQMVASSVENGKITISWSPSPKMFEYRVEYREQGNSDASWFNMKTTDDRVTLYDVLPGRSYEYRVGGSCTEGITSFGDIRGFKVPQRDTALMSRCGLIPNINISNRTPIAQLVSGDMIFAGDFPVRIITVNGAGSYSGTGYVMVPFLGDQKVAVNFNGITVNTDRKLIGGVIMTTYDANKKLASVGEVVNAIKDLASVVNDLGRLSLDMNYLDYKKITEELRKMAEDELPQELKDRVIAAADKMDKAKTDYDQAKKEYDEATTPEEKSKAKEKMKAAQSQLEEAKKEVEAVNKEKQKLIKAASDLIIKAIKSLKNDIKTGDSDKQNYQNALDALKSQVVTNAGETLPSGWGVADLGTAEEEASDQVMSDRRQFTQQVRDLYSLKLLYIRGELFKAFFKYFDSSDKVSQEFGKDPVVNGRQLLKEVLQKKQDKVPDDEIIEFIKSSLIKYLEETAKEVSYE